MTKFIVKVIICIAVCALLVMGYHALCGNVRDVKINKVNSAIYTQQDIDSAIKTVIRRFGWDFDWNGCKLTEISYAGDARNKQEAESSSDYGGDEVIVLTSDFNVGSSGYKKGLESNSKETDWTWILVRSSGGRWKIVSSGH